MDAAARFEHHSVTEPAQSVPALRMTDQEIEEFCHQNHIRKLSLFGSILTPLFRPDSDIDLLAEFERDAAISLLDVAAMEDDLGRRLGRKVDLRTAGDLSRYFRDEVLANAVVQYERS